MACARFIVTGKVQGVYFRASTRERARALDLSGWARNLPDGSVEVIACGEPEMLAQLEAWLQHGPAAARVAEVRREALSVQDTAGFEIG